MKLFHKLNKILLVFWGPILLGVMLWQALPVFAEDVGGSIWVDTTWALANSPYVLTSDVIVESGATLTIEPGVEIQGQSNAGLIVYGHLEALGTPTEPITFTSAFNTSPGDWPGIEIAGGTANLQQATIHYAGQYDSALNINDVATGGVVNLTDVTIENTMGVAMQVDAPAMHQVSMSNVTFMDNDWNIVEINASWDSFSADVELTPQPGLEGYFMFGDYLGVQNGTTLTLTAGVHMMTPENREFYVSFNGHLAARGTITNPVVFRSSPYNTFDRWAGIRVSGGTVDLEQTNIFGAGGAGGFGMLVSDVATGGEVVLTDVIIENTMGVAMQVEAPAMHQVSMNNVNFVDNDWNIVEINASWNSLLADVVLTSQPGLDYYLMFGDYATVPGPISLTVQAGARLETPAASHFEVNGRLHTSGTVSIHDLTNNGLLWIDGDGEITAEGIVTNTGRISHTVASVPNGIGTEFAFIKDQAGTQTKYHGVTITPTVAGDMGITTVSVRGQQPACDTGNSLIHRCFDITPSNPLPATIRFWYLLGETNGNDINTMQAYHWNGNAWDLLTDANGELRGTSGNDAWLEVDGVDSYSPFGLASETPTAVKLSSIYVNPDNGFAVLMIIAAVILACIVTMMTIFYYKKSAKN
jgi:hypothetical protein